MRIASELKKQNIESNFDSSTCRVPIIFKAWKVMECEYGSWKGMEITKTRFTLEEIFPDSRRIRNVLVPDSFCRLYTGAHIRNKNVPVWSRLRRF